MSIASAVRAGESLVRSALRHEDRCAWIGPLVGYDGDDANPPDGIIGPDLYAGTAGIAWFLACLYSSARREEFRRTAIAAMTHSLLASERIRRAKRCTFYLGTVGVVFAAVEVARRLDAPALETAARTRLGEVVARGRDGAPADLLTGTAGAIPALLVLAQRLHDDRLIEFAVSLGDPLIAAARRPARRGRGSAGFAHGFPGIACALVELFGATGDGRYRIAAGDAFARGSRSQLPTDFSWCNGAPGIALSRIRAWEVLGDPEHREKARAAIRATREAVSIALESDRGSFSLCHGLAGNAEVLYETRRAGDARLVARAVREAEARARLRCPGSPGLFLGLAGVACLALRLHDESLPSLLLLRHENFL